MPEPNYPLLFGRPPCVNGVWLAELDSSDICGILVMIARCVSYDTIRYILGANGEGHQQLHENFAVPISWVDYVFMNSDERVTARLLSNSVIEYLDRKSVV